MQIPGPVFQDLASLALGRAGVGIFKEQPSPRGALTLVILPPLKLAKRLRESVRTLDALWMVKRLLAGTFFLHLRGKRGQLVSPGTVLSLAENSHTAR